MISRQASGSVDVNITLNSVVNITLEMTDNVGATQASSFYVNATTGKLPGVVSLLPLRVYFCLICGNFSPTRVDPPFAAVRACVTPVYTSAMYSPRVFARVCKRTRMTARRIF